MIVRFPSTYGWANVDDAPSGSLAAREREKTVKVPGLKDFGLVGDVLSSLVDRHNANKESVLDHVERGDTDGYHYPSIDDYTNSGGSSEAGSMLGSGDTNSASSLDSNNWLSEFKTYLDGLISNQGKENQLNREYNSAEALLNRQFQAEQAQLERDWYTELSNSAYQRSIADLKKAGLNPALAYSQGGAATAGTGVPAGSAAAYTATGGDTMSSILSSIADVISSVSGASASKVSSAVKIFKLFM